MTFKRIGPTGHLRYDYTSGRYVEEIVEEPIRTLIIENSSGKYIEKYRLQVNNTLIYAKGKVNLNLNWPKDGSGKVQEGDNDKMPSSIYVFFGEDGFFYKTDSNNYYKYRYNRNNGQTKNIQTMSQFIELYCVNEYYNPLSNNSRYEGEYLYLPIGTKFKGWYTAKTGGKKIETVGDINKNTDLFKYKKTDTLPEITLYGRWELPTYTIKVHNIGRKGAKSSFEYYDEKTKKWIRTSGTVAFRNVLYGTKILSFINKRIRNPKYITWAKNELDGTPKQKELRAGPQKFLGWTQGDVGELDSEYYTHNHYVPMEHHVFLHKLDAYDNIVFLKRKDVDLYPNFQMIVIYKQGKVRNQTVGGVYKLYSPSDGEDAGLAANWFKIMDNEPPLPIYQYMDEKERYHYTYSWNETYYPSSRSTWKYDSKDIRWHPCSSTVVVTLGITKERY